MGRKDEQSTHRVSLPPEVKRVLREMQSDEVLPRFVRVFQVRRYLSSVAYFVSFSILHPNSNHLSMFELLIKQARIEFIILNYSEISVSSHSLPKGSTKHSII